MKNFITEYLSDDHLNIITDEIAKTEKGTSGEIRLCIRRKRGLLEKKLSPREIALKEFVRLNMHKTLDKTGVLLFLLLDERKFEIVADDGIDSKITSQKWEEISSSLISNFEKGEYLSGILSGIQKIGEILTREFPIKPDDKDELSNEIVIR